MPKCINQAGAGQKRVRNQTRQQDVQSEAKDKEAEQFGRRDRE